MDIPPAQKAEDLGIVKIEVNTASAGVKEVEKKLIKKYKLKSAKIIHAESDSLRLSYCGQAAANYITSVLRPNDTVSIFWGKTIAAWYASLSTSNFPTSLSYRW
jgi:deoxyribonucleoside regulator